MTEQPVVSPDACTRLIQENLTIRSAVALRRTVLDLISSGTLAPGTRLPTVRDLADALGMSRSSVGQAWSALIERGLIETRRKAGSFVLGKPAPPHARRFESMIRSSASMRLDLGNIRTDGIAQPDLGPAIDAALRNPHLHDVFAQPLMDELRAACEQRWPFAAGEYLAVHGIVDAAEMALSSLVGPGDRVIVESPSFSRVLDILESRGAVPILVDYLADGLDLDQLRRAKISKPSALIYQPNGSAPSGRSVSSAWLRDAAPLLDGSMPIVELSQMPLLHSHPQSLGRYLPSQVLHVESYNYFFGRDLHVAVIGGDADMVNALWMRLTYSSRWVSRILQGALAYLLTDPSTDAVTSAFVGEVRRRHTAFRASLAARGFPLDDASAPHIWLPVPDEHSTCIRLSKSGIVVHPGRHFVGENRKDQRVYINGAAIDSGFEEVSAAIAQACRRGA